MVFAQCVEVPLSQVSLGSCDCPGQLLPHPEDIGGGGDNGRGWDTTARDTCSHSMLPFPGSCSRKLLRQRISSLPVSAAGSCRVSGRTGTRRMEPGEGAGLCSTAHPLAVPQQCQLEASLVLKDTSQLQVRRDRVRQRQSEPEDEVRGAATLGGSERGPRGADAVSPPLQEGFVPKKLQRLSQWSRLPAGHGAVRRDLLAKSPCGAPELLVREAGAIRRNHGWVIMSKVALQPPLEACACGRMGGLGGHGDTLTPKLRGTGSWMDLGYGIRPCLGVGSSWQDLSPSRSPLPLPQVPPAAAVAE